MGNSNTASIEAPQNTNTSARSTQPSAAYPRRAGDEASALPPSQAAPVEAAQAVIAHVRDVAGCETISPHARAIAAQALLDALARALARVAIDLQPDGSRNLPEPDR